MSLMSFPFLLSSGSSQFLDPGASWQNGGKNDFLWLCGGSFWARKKHDEPRGLVSLASMKA